MLRGIKNKVKSAKCFIHFELHSKEYILRYNVDCNQSKLTEISYTIFSNRILYFSCIKIYLSKKNYFNFTLQILLILDFSLLVTLLEHSTILLNNQKHAFTMAYELHALLVQQNSIFAKFCQMCNFISVDKMMSK